MMLLISIDVFSKAHILPSLGSIGFKCHKIFFVLTINPQFSPWDLIYLLGMYIGASLKE